MIIISVDDGKLLTRDVNNYLIENGDELYFVEPVDVIDEAYLANIVSIVKEKDVKTVFSVGFYSQISMVCGVMNLEYISWVGDRNTINESEAIMRNKWNYIFVSEYSLYKKMQASGYENTFFLPLSYDNDIEEKKSPFSREYAYITDGIRMQSSSNDCMVELSDASKGYIDSIVENRKQDLNSEAVFENLADYVKKDIMVKYPYVGGNPASAPAYYDKSYFYPLLSECLAPPYIAFTRGYNLDLDINIVSEDGSRVDEGVLDIHSENIHYYSMESIREGKYKALFDFGFVIYLPKFSMDSSIPRDLWNLMACGVTVLSSAVYDFSFLENKPYIFKNKRELERLMRHIYADPNECKVRTEALKNEVRSMKNNMQSMACIAARLHGEE